MYRYVYIGSFFVARQRWIQTPKARNLGMRVMTRQRSFASPQVANEEMRWWKTLPRIPRPGFKGGAE